MSYGTLVAPAHCSAIYPLTAASFLLGCYALDENTGHRGGGVWVVTVEKEHPTTAETSEGSAAGGLLMDTTAQLLCEAEGVFDLSAGLDGSVVVAGADGATRLLTPADRAESSDSRLFACDVVLEGDEMATSSTLNFLTGDVITTHHKGGVRLYDSLGAKQPTAAWDGHEYDAWCSAWQDEHIFVTGGDDSLACGWDKRLEPGQRCYRLRHDAGVTSFWIPQPTEIEGLTAGPTSLITGSYDENVRLWDIRRPKFPLAQANVGGGVWRIRRAGQRLLLSTMQGGAVLLSPKDDLGTEDATVFSQHGSIVYDAAQIDGDMFASCSFYDDTVKVWSGADCTPFGE